MTAVTVRVPAKVNLQLAVGPVRADGYHDVATVYHAVSLFDEVTVAPAERDSVAVSGEGADSVPTDDGNLAARAAGALAQAVGSGSRDAPGLAIRITKRIPVAAGLAGGSADAAATLVACNELWGTGLSQQELCELASGIGSDVAFGLLGGTAIGIGRGEQVTPVLSLRYVPLGAGVRRLAGCPQRMCTRRAIACAPPGEQAGEGAQGGHCERPRPCAGQRAHSSTALG